MVLYNVTKINKFYINIVVTKITFLLLVYKLRMKAMYGNNRVRRDEVND